MNVRRAVLFQFAAALIIANAGSPGTPVDSTDDTDPEQLQQCRAYPNRKGAICPSVKGTAIVAEPGFTVGPGGVIGDPARSGLPNVGHIYVCQLSEEEIDTDYSRGRDLFLGAQRGGCAVSGGCITQECDPAVADVVDQNVGFCLVDDPANVDGLRICSLTRDNLHGTWIMTFRIKYTALARRPDGPFTDLIHLKFFGSLGSTSFGQELVGLSNLVPARPLYVNNVTIPTMPLVNYPIQLTVDDEYCAGIPGIIGETENYELVVTPGNVRLRAFGQTTQFIPFGCP